MADAKAAERVAIVDTAIQSAIGTLVAMYGIAEGDAAIAVASRITDILAEIAPHSIGGFFATRVATKRAQMAGIETPNGKRALEKAIKAHMRAVDRVYDEAQATLAKLERRL